MRKMLFGTLAAGVVAAALVFATSAEAAVERLCFDHWAIDKEEREKGGGKPEEPDPPEEPESPEEPEGDFFRVWTNSGSHFDHEDDEFLGVFATRDECLEAEGVEPEDPELPEY